MSTNNIRFEISGNKNKKYTAILPDGKRVDFGAKGYDQYKDQTPLKAYSHLDHLDKDRRDKYRARHSKIKTKDGKLAYKVKYSPSWFSWNWLW